MDNQNKKNENEYESLKYELFLLNSKKIIISELLKCENDFKLGGIAAENKINMIDSILNPSKDNKKEIIKALEVVAKYQGTYKEKYFERSQVFEALDAIYVYIQNLSTVDLIFDGLTKGVNNE